MKDNFDRGELGANFKERIEKFEEYYNDPEQEHKIFTELGFTYVDNSRDGFRPECEQKYICRVYPDLKDDWDSTLSNLN